jgi:hypothetical protein
VIKPLFLIGWLICSVFLHAEFVDLQEEPKFVAYSNSIDYSGHSIGEAFYHADTFAALNRNVMPLPARATGTHGLPSGLTHSQAPTLGGLAERYGASTSASRLGGHGAGPHHGTSQLGSVSEHQASHASGVSGGGVVISKAPGVVDDSSAIRALQLKKQLHAEQLSGVRMPTQIYGYTKHGMNRAISRDGVGVSTESILKTWRNPSNIEYVPTKLGPSFRLTGFDSTIVINSDGKIITAWADNLLGVRLK